MKQLRQHQIDAIAMLRQSLGRGNRRPMVQAPTGFGKTLLAANIIRMARAKGNRVIFCVNAVSLINQTVEAFWSEGIREIGVLQGQHELTNPNMPVQVCSVQTLRNRRIPEAELVIIDEAHNWFKFYGKWMADWDAVPFVGLSATPWTRGLGKHYDDLIIAATTQDLIDRGYLSDFRVFAPSHPDLSGVRTVAGDYHEGDLGAAMDKSPLIADIVKTWLERAERRPTFCFAVNRAHAKHLQEQFEAAGVRAGYVDSFTEVEEREEIKQKFHSGEIKVVCNVGVLTTGIDWDVRCIVLARPTKSEILFTQIVGRGLRTADGKDNCLILDHSDTHTRLGFVTHIDHDQLCDGKPQSQATQERKEPLPKECPSCTFLKPARAHQCPACGFKPERRSDVEVEAGELQEITGSKAQSKRNRATPPEEKAHFFGELKHYGLTHGYKSGWAPNKYRDRFGVWPNAFKDAPLQHPTPETLSWIKSTQIRYAKRRAA